MRKQMELDFGRQLLISTREGNWPDDSGRLPALSGMVKEIKFLTGDE